MATLMAPWRDEDIQKARDLVLAGMTLAQAAEHFPGRSASALATKLWKLGVSNMGKQARDASKANDARGKRKATHQIELVEITEEWTGTQETKLVSMWYGSADIERIAKATDKSVESVLKKVQNMRLHDRTDPKQFAKDSRGQRFRVCMSCNTAFMSEGPQHRLCGCYWSTL